MAELSAHDIVAAVEAGTIRFKPLSGTPQSPERTLRGYPGVRFRDPAGVVRELFTNGAGWFVRTYAAASGNVQWYHVHVEET